MENCTRCGKVFTEFKIDINFNIRVDSLKDDNTWEYIPNLDNESREILCNECFDKFSELMGQLGIKHDN